MPGKGGPLVAVAIGDPARAVVWREALAAALPEDEVALADDVADLAAPEFAVAWGVPGGALRRFPRLRAVLSLGAGVDRLLGDPAMPDVPVVRMVEPGLTRGMREYVLLHVLRHHRDMPRLARQQAARRWDPFASPLAEERGVGVMGLGVLGADAAAALAAVGFRVAGWSRRPKALPGIEGFAGAAGLAPFLARSEILVCLLPLTAATASILDARLLAALPRGAALVNAARGEHLVEADLLAALASGHLSGATLDAFDVEPLPPEHPFWAHPAICVTPHNASLTRPEDGARSMAEAIRRIRAGETPANLADRAAGY
jgi:glyoxylate/hydroxypyruvate reductase A